MIKPKYLTKGNTIGIIAPSSDLASKFPHRIKNAKLALESLGFKVKLFPTCFKEYNGNAGKIEERVKDIHEAFLNNDINAILCAIGGTSAIELLDKINYNIITKNPKIFCGYSDITILHYAILKKCNLITFYGPNAMTQFGEYPKPLQYTIKYFFKALRGERIGNIKSSEKYTDEVLDWNKKLDLTRHRHMKKNKGYIWLKEGKVKTKIIGGCITSIRNLIETDYYLDPKNKILFLDIPEGKTFAKGLSISVVEDIFRKFATKGVFSKIKGLIVGRPFNYSDNDISKLKEIIVHYTENYPVLFNANIGHADPIITIPQNTDAHLNSKENMFSLEESSTIKS